MYLSSSIGCQFNSPQKPVCLLHYFLMFFKKARFAKCCFSWSMQFAWTVRLPKGIRPNNQFLYVCTVTLVATFLIVCNKSLLKQLEFQFCLTFPVSRPNWFLCLLACRFSSMFQVLQLVSTNGVEQLRFIGGQSCQRNLTTEDLFDR